MIFTDAELDYLRGQTLGRLATVQPDGTLQNSPVAFSYNEALDTIDITGFTMAASQKFHNVAANGQVAFVVDDIPSTDPWRVRCLEIRGSAQALTEEQGAGVALIRISPRRIVSFGMTPTGQEPHRMTVSKRNVAASSAGS
jgi:pyridoxamine 5'-phosphate oxidase family protein